ncbi:fumarylacetoacetate hydrolase family protein [Novosphingobium sp. BL-52-GroH]|uniref:fumarylacetoacetate hydrolase family protein n=1 Tax=Novosphingobium sp. BL-52-GroH TaxID=3349877 RepID=UPI00384CE9B8
MKLARFEIKQVARLGVVVDDTVVPLDSLGVDFSDMVALIEAGPGALERIARALDAGEGDPVPLAKVRLLAPLRPRKFLGLGMNYRRHADEARALGIAFPDGQMWFNKQTSCINGPYDDVAQGVTGKLDYEVELGVVIGAAAKSVGEGEASAHIFGYLVVNDVSARDWQFQSPTITLGKSFDTHGPIGPWIVTADEIPDPAILDVRCLVNDEVRQSSNTEQFIHSIPAQIAHLSTAFTLEPGDILATGTPEGVGAALQPPRFLAPGDVVRCEIAGIGFIENRIVP